MNRIITTDVLDPSIQQPFTARSLDFLQDTRDEAFRGLCTNIVGNDYNSGIGYKISGVNATGSVYSEGFIWYNNELFYCAGGNITGYANPARLIVTVTNDGTADPLEFTDGVSRNVHNVNRLVISDVASGGILLSSLIGTTKTKHINIGPWNMNITAGGTAVAFVSIPHTLSLVKIRSVSVFIFNDAQNTLYPISYVDLGGLIKGTVDVDSTNINPSIFSGGLFDSASFNDTSVNRGYITITYQD